MGPTLRRDLVVRYIFLAIIHCMSLGIFQLTLTAIYFKYLIGLSVICNILFATQRLRMHVWNHLEKKNSDEVFVKRYIFSEKMLQVYTVN